MLILRNRKPNYPDKLNRLSDPPKSLYIKSDNWEELKQMPALAIIGSRRPTSYGAAVCAQLAKEAASRGVVIISGLALGIDSVAHKAALEVNGKTIAVLPSGLDNIYPSSHYGLANQIIKQGGALISEYAPPEKIAFKSNFIARNRIIAGLADAVLVPEAAEGSGSLHTAHFALDIGIDVLAAPGQITNPTARGSNNLIKTGATLVTNTSDVLNALNIAANPHRPTYNATNITEEHILAAIADGVNDAEQILALSGINIELFNQTVTMLEINGQIKPGGNNTWYLN